MVKNSLSSHSKKQFMLDLFQNKLYIPFIGSQSTFNAFPAIRDPQVHVQLFIVYENHGGLSINKPFKVNDTDTVKICQIEGKVL